MTNHDNPPLVYTAQSKMYFYCRDAVCEFVLQNGAVPLHPFRLFNYFLDDRVERDVIRSANSAVVDRSDETWVFGKEIANGVLAEISQTRIAGKPIRFFTIATRASEIVEISPKDLTFEPELLTTTSLTVEHLHTIISDRKQARPG